MGALYVGVGVIDGAKSRPRVITLWSRMVWVGFAFHVCRCGGCYSRWEYHLLRMGPVVVPWMDVCIFSHVCPLRGRSCV